MIVIATCANAQLALLDIELKAAARAADASTSQGCLIAPFVSPTESKRAIRLRFMRRTLIVPKSASN